MVTFLPGQTTASVSVSIVDDSNIEDTEMFSATLAGVSNVVIGSDDTATVTILDDDRKSIIMVALYLCGGIIIDLLILYNSIILYTKHQVFINNYIRMYIYFHYRMSRFAQS